MLGRQLSVKFYSNGKYLILSDIERVTAICGFSKILPWKCTNNKLKFLLLQQCKDCWTRSWHRPFKKVLKVGALKPVIVQFVGNKLVCVYIYIYYYTQVTCTRRNDVRQPCCLILGLIVIDVTVILYVVHHVSLRQTHCIS